MGYRNKNANEKNFKKKRSDDISHDKGHHHHHKLNDKLTLTDKNIPWRSNLPEVFCCIKSDYLKEIENLVATKILELSSSIYTRAYGINTSSHNLTRHHPFSFYAASSVLLVLCYLTSPVTTTEINPIFDESSSDKEILDHLLKNSRYDKRLLPPVNGTLTVNVNVLLLSLASPDESSLKYEVEFLLNQQWADPRLEYGNRSQYEFLNAIHHHEDIWLPDTYFIMHGDFKDPIIPMHFSLRIFRNGTIYYAMRRHLILSCQGSLNIFPFDDPLCSFAMESISYELSAVKYVWKNDEDTLRKSPSLTTLNAYLIKNATILCPFKNSWRGNYSCLKVDLTFTRDRAFYFTTVFIPGIILVTSSFITFWLEWNAVPARVMIGVTTMLNFFTTSNGFRSTLPVVSNLTAMNVWDGVCMCFIYASLLEFVCVNYVGRKRPLHNVVYRPGENPVTQRLPAVLSRIGIILASPLNVIEQEFLAAVSSESVTSSSLGVSSMRSQGVHTRQGDGTQAITNQKQEVPATTTRTVEVQTISTTNIREEDSDMEIEATKKTTEVQTFSSLGPRTAEESYQGSESDLELTAKAPQTETFSDIKTPPDEPNPEDHLESIQLKSDEESSGVDIPTVVISNIESDDVMNMEREYPIRPPRRRGTNRNVTLDMESHEPGEKKRENTGPNEIVACTCGSGSSPCTHSANNGCATETCFVQIRKKEPPHPIRVAKTIDVIARVTFPTAYAIFLIFFFIHYKAFS